MSWNTLESSMQNEGGFMDTSVSTDDKSNLKRGQNCVPVMAQHVLRHGDEIKLWGTPVKIVQLVGVIRSIEQVTTKATFTLEDETGTIQIIKWLEAEATVYDTPVQEGQYAKVFGIIRSRSAQNKDHHIVACKIQPVKSIQEVLNHCLEVDFVSLQGEKFLTKTADADTNFANNSMSAMNHSINTVPGLDGDQTMILNIIKSFADDENGAERSYIYNAVPAHVRSKLDDVLEFLSCEGHIYTTKTDDFFKAI